MNKEEKQELAGKSENLVIKDYEKKILGLELEIFELNNIIDAKDEQLETMEEVKNSTASDDDVEYNSLLQEQIDIVAEKEKIIISQSNHIQGLSVANKKLALALNSIKNIIDMLEN